MPSVATFKKGFGLKKGLQVGNYKLTKLSVTHIERIKYRTYEFPIEMEWTLIDDEKATKKNVQKLVKELKTFVKTGKGFSKKGDLILYSQYKNPYLCNVGAIEEAGKQPKKYPEKIILVSLGTGYRLENEDVNHPIIKE